MHMATTTHEEQAMTTEQLIDITTSDAIVLADLITKYREARADHRQAWERADAAFAKYMRGDAKNGGAARRAEQIAENATTELFHAKFELTARGIDSELIDQHDETNCAPHYDLAS
jgi:hypothetical protein